MAAKDGVDVYYIDHLRQRSYNSKVAEMTKKATRRWKMLANGEDYLSSYHARHSQSEYLQ